MLVKCGEGFWVAADQIKMVEFKAALFKTELPCVKVHLGEGVHVRPMEPGQDGAAEADRLAEAVNAIVARPAPGSPGWIGVRSSTPRRGDRVLVSVPYSAGNYVHEAFYSEGTWRSRDWESSNAPTPVPTHWMPLPEPPEWTS